MELVRWRRGRSGGEGSLNVRCAASIVEAGWHEQGGSQQGSELDNPMSAGVGQPMQAPCAERPPGFGQQSAHNGHGARQGATTCVIL